MKLRTEAIGFTLALARAGIKELGEDYRSNLQVVDDSDLKIDLAKDYVKKGDLKYGAKRLIRSLGTRLRLYKRANAKTVVK